MLVLFLGLILFESSVANASDCYQLFYNWDCIDAQEFRHERDCPGVGNGPHIET